MIDPVMLAGWIGFGLLLLGFVGITLKWFSASGFFYPITMVLASAAYGYMNYSLAVWPGFWSNIVFGLIAVVAYLAAIGRAAEAEITDKELDAMSAEAEKENSDGV